MLERLYKELAWAYDGISWLVSLGRWQTWIRVALRYVRGERVLEVGCGTGRLLVALAEGRQVWGYDLSRAMLRQARRRLARTGLQVPLCRGRAQSLPFAAEAFGSVVCTFPSAYIDSPSTWAEFRRVLVPGGRAVVVYGAALGELSPFRRLARMLLVLGRVSKPAKAAHRDTPDLPGLRTLRLIVTEAGEQVHLLVAERDDAADAG